MDLRRLPKVDRLVDAGPLERYRIALGRRALTQIVRDAIEVLRRQIRTSGAAVPEEQELLSSIAAAAEQRLNQGVVRVINATGVVLHTNLGRAPLPRESIEALVAAAGGYSSLELDVELGARARRGASADARLAELTSAEDALIVNNNAAAVLLCLSTLAAGREVLVSRGELVEIGGGFRIPEVLARSGAELREVGTTNRTRVDDYARAITARTACILRVHPSNFKVTGFAERPGLDELAALARSSGVLLIKDLGGGLIVPPPSALSGADAAREPSVQACLRAGADLVCFSLDKLFGGPQGGAVVGRAALVERLRDDPLARALRVDKLTLLALAPVLTAYATSRHEALPVFALINRTQPELEATVEGWRRELGELARHTSVERTQAAIGGGTLAEAELPSVALALAGASADVLARALRREKPAVIPRILEGRVLIDARTVLPDDEPFLLRALANVLRSLEATHEP